MKTFLLAALLALAVNPARAGQDQTSKPYTVVVGHVVKLSWTASTSTNVVSYQIYVGSVSGGPYNKIGATTGLTFSDLNATAGNTYYYVVTAIDDTGTESAYSNEAMAAIPNP